MSGFLTLLSLFIVVNSFTLINVNYSLHSNIHINNNKKIKIKNTNKIMKIMG